MQRPTVIGWYNYGMGGTDVFDQMLSYYRTSVKSKRWPHAIIFHSLLACAVNAWKLYKLAYDLKKHDECGNFKSFLEKLIVQLCGDDVSTPSSDSETELDDTDSSMAVQLAPKRRKTAHASADDPRFTGNHQVCQLPSYDSDGHRNSRSCMAPRCTSQTSTVCMQCGVYLCIKFAKNGTCFQKYFNPNCYT